MPDDPGCVLLADRARLAPGEWLALIGSNHAARGRVLLLGVRDDDERARLLRLGIGDLAPPGCGLGELEARALRLAARQVHGPLARELGALRLDLTLREGFVAGRRLALHPREFSVLWRLAVSPGELVGPAALLADVWRLAHRPETNSLAVHVSRLRGKLRIAGLDGAIQSLPGGYRLALGPAESGLDAAPAMDEEARKQREDLPDETRIPAQ